MQNQTASTTNVKFVFCTGLPSWALQTCWHGTATVRCTVRKHASRACGLAACLVLHRRSSRAGSICALKRNVHCIVPEKDFELLEGRDNLSTYTFNTNVAKHTFCKTCGVVPFYRPRSNPEGYAGACARREPVEAMRRRAISCHAHPRGLWPHPMQSQWHAWPPPRCRASSCARLTGKTGSRRCLRAAFRS